MAEQRVTAHIDVSQNMTVKGVVEAGASVRDGALLIVNGFLTGPLLIELGGAVFVNGVMACDSIRNEGVLTVQGIASAALPRTGVVLVAAGSAIDLNAISYRLAEDGSLAPLPHDSTLNADVDSPLLRYLRDGRFEPTDIVM